MKTKSTDTLNSGVEWSVNEDVNRAKCVPSEDTSGFYLSIPEEQVDIFGKIWNTKSKPKATLTFIHGLGEHILRYDDFFEYLSANGVRVFGYDQRGFGRTLKQSAVAVNGVKPTAMTMGDNQGEINQFSDIYRAVKGVGIKLREDNVPHFLMGHSMGGFLTLKFICDYYSEELNLAGVIASAPVIKPAMDIPWIKKTMGKLLSKVLGSLNVPSDLDVTAISRDEEIVEIYKKDPYVHGMVSLRLANMILAEGEQILISKHMKFPSNLPLYMAFGSADRICSFDAGKELLEKIDVEDKTFKTYDGLFHELHNEPEKKTVWKDYLDWIMKHV